MKILIVRSSWIMDFGASYESAFKALGHDVRIFTDNPPHWHQAATKIFSRTPFKARTTQHLEHYRRLVSEQLLNEALAYRPDLIFVIRGTFLTKECIAAARTELRIPVVNWVIDNPMVPNILEPAYVETLGIYSHLFILDEGWQWPLTYLGADRITHLPHAADEAIFHHEAIPKDIDLFFVGSLSPQYPNTASGIMRASVLDYLVRKDFAITAVAPGISKIVGRFPALARMTSIDRSVSPSEINHYYNRAKIVLNVNAPQLNRDCSERLFAVAMSNNFQLIDYKEAMPDYFPVDAVTSYSSLENLAEQCRYYLAHDSEREHMAKKSYEIAVQKHGYLERAKQVLVESA